VVRRRASLCLRIRRNDRLTAFAAPGILRQLVHGMSAEHWYPACSPSQRANRRSSRGLVGQVTAHGLPRAHGRSPGNPEPVAGTHSSLGCFRGERSFDVQYLRRELRRLMSTGRNSPTKEAAKEDLLHYLSGSCTRDELAALAKLSPDELAERHYYKIFKHLTPYPADKRYSSL
jgi:hypothetical protein